MLRSVAAMVAAGLLAASSWTAAQAQGPCGGPVSLQFLGTGGPIAEGHRAGSSAVVWLDGKAVLLVDAGSGAFTRYGEAGIHFEDHRAILLTHFHADHVADLSAILNSGGFSDRTAALPVIGPTGNQDFPGLRDHLHALLDPETGAFRYLSGYLTGRDGKVLLQPEEVDPADAPIRFDLGNGLAVTAIGVEHGVVPALGYLVEVGGKTIVFAGDQNAQSDAFVAELKGRAPDILVVHNVIPEGPGQPIGLHRSPADLGELAAALKPRLLVLAHNMQRALSRQAEGEAAIRRSWRGPLVVADDLACFAR